MGGEGEGWGTAQSSQQSRGHVRQWQRGSQRQTVTETEGDPETEQSKTEQADVMARGSQMSDTDREQDREKRALRDGPSERGRDNWGDLAEEGETASEKKRRTKEVRRGGERESLKR